MTLLSAPNATQANSVAAIPAEYHQLTGLQQLPKHTPKAITPATADISPFGISLQVSELSQQFSLNDLFSELDLHAEATGSQPKAQQIWLQGDGLTTLPPAELTQLAYRVGSQFQLDEGEHSEYGIDICQSQINPEHFALLRGLRFKQLRIHFGSRLKSGSSWLGEVADNIELLNNYDFKAVYCRVHLADFNQPSDIKNLLLSLQLYRPQQIELAGAINPLDGSVSQRGSSLYLGLIEFLMQRGYQPLGNHLFVSEQSHRYQLHQQRNLAFTPWGFCSAQLTRWLGMGLDAAGQFDHQHYQNTSSATQYRQLLSQGNLPQIRSGELPEHSLALDPLIQSLFCYGEMDGRQVDALPAKRRFAVESVIAEATERLWIESAGYLWRLTPCGRVHLRQLFCQLVKPLGTEQIYITPRKISL